MCPQRVELYTGHTIPPAWLWPSDHDDDDDDGDDDDGDHDDDDDDDEDVDKTRSVADAHDSLCPPARSPSHRQSPTGHLSFPQEFPLIHIHIHCPSYPSSLISIVPLIHRPSYPLSLLSIAPLIHIHIHLPSMPSSLLSIAPIIHIHIHGPSCISTSTSLFLPLFSTVHSSYPQDTTLIHKTSLILKPSLLSTRHPSFPEAIRHPIFKRLTHLHQLGLNPFFSVTRKFDLRSCSKHYDK